MEINMEWLYNVYGTYPDLWVVNYVQKVSKSIINDEVSLTSATSPRHCICYSLPANDWGFHAGIAVSGPQNLKKLKCLAHFLK